MGECDTLFGVRDDSHTGMGVPQSDPSPAHVAATLPRGSRVAQTVLGDPYDENVLCHQPQYQHAGHVWTAPLTNMRLGTWLYNGRMKDIRSNMHILLREKERREGRRISLRAIARETGLSYYTVNALAYERLAHYPKDLLVTLCTYFGCSVGDLLTLVEIESAATRADAAPDTSCPPG